MHQTPGTQSNRSFWQVWGTSTWAVGLVVCAVSSVYAFSPGALPSKNCLSPADCIALNALLETHEEVHQKITRTALSALVFVPTSGGTPVAFSSKTMTIIEDANAKTDYNQEDHSLHFDNAKLEDSSSRLLAGKGFLIEKLEVRPTINRRQAYELRRTLGMYLHTLQDFYAHSNYSTLAHPPSINLGESVIPDPPLSEKPCLPGNTSEFSPEGLDDSLTSGDAGSFLDLQLANANNDEKCAHGLVENGIHKDWTGRKGHKRAYELALIGTQNFVASIINHSSNNPDNVCMLMTDKPCQESNPWPGFYSGSVTSTCGFYSGPQTASISAVDENTISVTASGGGTYLADFSGTTAVSTSISGATLTLSGNTLTVSYPPGCQSFIGTRS